MPREPRVTVGFLVSKRIALGEALGYLVAQFLGAIIGALVLWAVVQDSPVYSRSRVGLGTNGSGKNSQIHLESGARSPPRSS